MTAISVVPPPMSITMLPVGVSTGRPTPIAAAIGSATMNTSFAPAPSAESRTARLLHLGDPRRHAHDHARLHLEHVVLDDELEEVAQHLLGHVEVGDHAVLHRAHRDDAVGRAAEHALRLEAHALDLLRLAVDRDDGRLVQDDALALHVDERVRRAEIDGDGVRREESTFLKERPTHRVRILARLDRKRRLTSAAAQRGTGEVSPPSPDGTSCCQFSGLRAERFPESGTNEKGRCTTCATAALAASPARNGAPRSPAGPPPRASGAIPRPRRRCPSVRVPRGRPRTRPSPARAAPRCRASPGRSGRPALPREERPGVSTSSRVNTSLRSRSSRTSTAGRRRLSRFRLARRQVPSRVQRTIVPPELEKVRPPVNSIGTVAAPL